MVMGIHGGDLFRAMAAYGIPDGRWVDFSANLNPLGPPAILVEALEANLAHDMAQYPDPDCTSLKDALSRRHGVPPSCILPCNGGSEAIFLAARAVPSLPALVPQPCFVEYAQALRAAGNPVHTPVMPGLRVNPDWLLSQLDGVGSVWLGHPNNPTSRLVEELPQIIEQAARHGVVVVVDEAFIDLTLTPQATVAGMLCRFPNLIILRSLTKLLCMPGIRLGYVMAHPRLVERMRQMQPAWSVGAQAQRAGRMLGVLGEFEAQTAAWLREELAYAQAALSLPGLRLMPAQANFMLLRCERFYAAELKDRLARQGVWIRDASNFTGLDAHHVRVAVRTRAENERLAAALSRVLCGD